MLRDGVLVVAQGCTDRWQRSMKVTKMINNLSRDSSQLGHLVKHVKHLMKQGRRSIVNKISGEMNQALVEKGPLVAVRNCH